jgi:hypothetical protein
LIKLPEETLITILDGPNCVDESNWWKVLTDGNGSGWMAESQNDVYLLEPLQ